MKASWQTITSGLDQLFFSPLIDDETVDERGDCIDAFLAFNGWTWDDVIAEMAKEDGRPMRAQ